MSHAKAELGGTGEAIAVRLWPSLRLVASGSQTDRGGTDAWLNGQRVRIKTDRRIVESRMLFWELGKRNGTWSSFGQAETQWRWSPCRADRYIFVTHGLAINISLDGLFRLARNRSFKDINGTAIGFLIPLAAVRALTDSDIEIVEHEERL